MSALSESYLMKSSFVRGGSAPIVMVVRGAFWLMFVLPACGQTQLSVTQRQQMIARLESVKALDERNAVESTDPVEAADCRDQANAADRAIRELEFGYAVSPEEFENALEVPPPSISLADRVELIDQLEAAKRMDEDFVELPADDPVPRDEYAERADRVDRVIKDLTIGEDVPWTTIKQALEVPDRL